MKQRTGSRKRNSTPGTCASCHRFLAHLLRLMSSALAYTLMNRLREIALVNTELAKACTATIRVSLLKFAGTVVRNVWRVGTLLDSLHPMRQVIF